MATRVSEGWCPASSVFVVGGLTGVMLAAVPFDWQVSALWRAGAVTGGLVSP